MTTEKLIEVLEFYRTYIEEKKKVYQQQMSEAEYQAKWVCTEHGYKHILWMIEDAVSNRIPAGEIDKVMRWLGFIQGVLFWMGDFSVNELRQHSGVPAAKPEEQAA